MDIVLPTFVVSLMPLSLLISFKPIYLVYGLETKIVDYAILAIILGEYGQLAHLQDLLHFLNVQDLLQEIYGYNIPGLNPLIDRYNLLLCIQNRTVDWGALKETLFRILTLIVQRQVNQNDVFLLERFKEDQSFTEFFLRCVIANLHTQESLF